MSKNPTLVVTQNIAEKLKSLRINCEDDSVFRKVCRANKKYSICNKSSCNGCNDYTFNGKRDITQERLANTFVVNFENLGSCSKETIANFEKSYKNTRKIGCDFLDAYETLFDVDFRYDKNADTLTVTKKDTCLIKKEDRHEVQCFERDDDVKELKAILKAPSTEQQNNDGKGFGVIVVCAEGGVGKTTLVKQLINELDENMYQYYQTVVLSEATAFSEDAFIENVKLSVRGQDELSDKKTDEKADYIRRDLARAQITPVIVFDDLDLADYDDILNMWKEYYDNCQFIITTRRAVYEPQYENAIWNLNNFTKEQAFCVFNKFLKNNGASPLCEEEEEKFEPIYEWCEGNAEVLYFIAKMLGRVSVDYFNEFLKQKSFDSKASRGKKENSSMAEKLKYLFGFDKNFLPSFDSPVKVGDEKAKLIKTLAVLSVTKMNKIPIQTLIDFLSYDGNTVSSAQAIDDLYDKGLINIDNGYVYMHTLISNALKLNRIENQYSDDVKLFLYLYTNDKSLYEELKIGEISKVRIPGGIEEIPNSAFEKSKGITELIISKNVTSIGENAFFECKNLKKILFEENCKLRILRQYCFSGTGIESIALPDNLQYVLSGVFDKCFDLRGIFISKSVTDIRGSSFGEVPNLEEISVAVDNKEFVSHNGNLYAWDMYSLVKYASGKPDKIFSLPEDTNSICEMAFAYSNNLEEIHDLSVNISKIGDYAFLNCKKLTCTPSNPYDANIGKDVYLGCDALDSTALLIERLVREEVIKQSPYFHDERNAALMNMTVSDEISTLKRGFFSSNIIESVSIHKNVNEIEVGAVGDCFLLKEIFVAPQNLWFSSVDGNLYSKDWQTFLRYAPGKENDEFSIPDDVKLIEKESFSYVNALKKIIISKSVNKIAEKAFYHLPNLNEYIVVPENKEFTAIDGNLYDYSGTTLISFAPSNPITSFDVPKNVIKISPYAFCQSKHLRKLVIHKDVSCLEVESILENEFLEEICVDKDNPYFASKDGVLYDKEFKTLIRFPQSKVVDTFILPNSVSNIGRSAFEKCRINKVLFSNKSSIQVIEANAFRSSFLTEIEIPHTLEHIDVLSFASCCFLEKVVFEKESKINAINSFAFHNCRRLKEITLPKSVKLIDSHSFEHCIALEKINIDNIANTLEFIGDSAFANCTMLKSISIPSKVNFIGESAFFHCKFLESIVIPSNIEIISNSTFSRCFSLENIVIPTNVKIIGDSSFSYCTSLENITIPKNVTSIGDSAFYYCRTLENVMFEEGSRLECIGDSAFNHCLFLRSIVFPPSVKHIGNDAFFLTHINENSKEECGEVDNLIHSIVEKLAAEMIENEKNIESDFEQKK